jgi:sugar diacid utilization regulator
VIKRSAREPTTEDPDIRTQLSNLRAILALSMLMTEATDEESVLELLAEAAFTLTSSHLEGAYLDTGRWRQTRASRAGSAMLAHLQDQLAVVGRMGGRIDFPTEAWAWAYPMRSLTGHAGYVLVSASAEPCAHEQFELRVLAQQAGLALTNARLHAQERATAEELATVNARLEETVGALRQGMEIHEKLTEAAAAGVGLEGITEILHQLTGLPVIVEDRYGERQAACGAGAGQRGLPRGIAGDRLLRDALEHRRPLRTEGGWLALARTRYDILGVLVLIDPDERADDQALMALEHAATVLAMELAHLQALAETELRLRRDIVEDLLASADERSIVMRAHALDYDLRRPHRVVVVTVDDPIDVDRLFRAVRRAAFETGAGSLLVGRADAVVLLTHTDVPWPTLQAAVDRALGGAPCRIGVGGPCLHPGDFPRSHREARFALRLAHVADGAARAQCFDDLGVFRLFGGVADPVDLEKLVQTWLSKLLEYDREHGYRLVPTLSAYLEFGGSHKQTAEAVVIHRSTLKYRLQRIREISGHDLDDPDTRFHLQLATRAWRTLQTLQL